MTHPIAIYPAAIICGIAPIGLQNLKTSRAIWRVLQAVKVGNFRHGTLSKLTLSPDSDIVFYVTIMRSHTLFCMMWCGESEYGIKIGV